MRRVALGPFGYIVLQFLPAWVVPFKVVTQVRVPQLGLHIPGRRCSIPLVAALRAGACPAGCGCCGVVRVRGAAGVIAQARLQSSIAAGCERHRHRRCPRATLAPSGRSQSSDTGRDSDHYRLMQRAWTSQISGRNGALSLLSTGRVAARYAAMVGERLAEGGALNAGCNVLQREN